MLVRWAKRYQRVAKPRRDNSHLGNGRRGVSSGTLSNSGFSIDLDVIALRLFHLLGELFPVLAILLGNRRKALLHSALHTLQAAHIDVSLGALHQIPELLAILSHLRLNVHLLSRGILVLPGNCIVEAELIRVLLLVLRVLVVIEKGLRVWHPH